MAHEDLHELLNAVLPFAREMIAKRGAFLPFGACLNIGGRIDHVAGWRGEEQPEPQEVIDMMTLGLRQQAENGEIRASAICVDLVIVPPGRTERTDAVCVRLEHSNGEAVDVFLPYHKTPSGAHEYAELFAAGGRQEVFQPHHDGG